LILVPLKNDAGALRGTKGAQWADVRADFLKLTGIDLEAHTLRDEAVRQGFVKPRYRKKPPSTPAEPDAAPDVEPQGDEQTEIADVEFYTDFEHMPPSVLALLSVNKWHNGQYVALEAAARARRICSIPYNRFINWTVERREKLATDLLCLSADELRADPVWGDLIMIDELRKAIAEIGDLCLVVK